MNFMFAALLIVVTSLGELEGGPDKYIDVPDKYIVSFCVQYKNEQLIVIFLVLDTWNCWAGEETC